MFYVAQSNTILSRCLLFVLWFNFLRILFYIGRFLTFSYQLLFLKGWPLKEIYLPTKTANLASFSNKMIKRFAIFYLLSFVKCIFTKLKPFKNMINSVFLKHHLKQSIPWRELQCEHVKKLVFLTVASPWGGGDDSTPTTPAATKCKFFFSTKCLDCSETKEYAKTFVKFCKGTRWKLKNLFSNIFLK